MAFPLPPDFPGRATAEAFDPQRLHRHDVGACGGPGITRRREPPVEPDSQSVEYFGWTFSPRSWAIALFTAIAASPKPIEMSVIFPS